MLKETKSFFTFSKKELNGLFVFCILVSLIAFAPSIYSFFYPPRVYSYDDFEREIAEFKASAVVENSNRRWSVNSKAVPAKNISYFRFNPNSLTEGEWEKLGLSPRQIKVILNYVNKGGKFYKKEDLKKIYSVTDADFRRLEPYIDIPVPSKTASSPVLRTKYRADRTTTVLDINLADSSQLEGLSGIGPAFASRIIKYRDRLGGFHDKKQLREVYGIDSLKYSQLEKQLSVSFASLKKIEINKANFDDLKRHPYLTYKQMNAILQYRKQHGPFRSIEDLRKIVILNEGILRKIEPYLTFNDR